MVEEQLLCSRSIYSETVNITFLLCGGISQVFALWKWLVHEKQQHVLSNCHIYLQ